MIRSFGAAAVLAVALTAPASAYLAQNDLLVRDTGGDTFKVPYRGLNGPADFWCAAGDYVIRSLDMAPETRIYRTSSVPRRAGQGMTFSLSPDGAKRSGLARLDRKRGVSAAHARNLCETKHLLRD